MMFFWSPLLDSGFTVMFQIFCFTLYTHVKTEVKFGILFQEPLFLYIC